jgi:hypothetical protein
MNVKSASSGNEKSPSDVTSETTEQDKGLVAGESGQQQQDSYIQKPDGSHEIDEDATFVPGLAKPGMRTMKEIMEGAKAAMEKAKNNEYKPGPPISDEELEVFWKGISGG